MHEGGANRRGECGRLVHPATLRAAGQGQRDEVGIACDDTELRNAGGNWMLSLQ